MNVLSLILDYIPSLAVGILAGQKVRITLGGHTVPKSGLSRKVRGKSTPRAKAGASDLAPLTLPPSVPPSTEGQAS